MRFLIAPAFVFIATASDRNYQTDFWHHLARGRAIAQAGRLVDVDVFTFTVAGQPLKDANWLTQVLYFRLFERGGLDLVQLANSLVLALAATVLVATCRSASRSMLAAAAATTFAVCGSWQLLLIRPQTVSILLFVTLFATLSAVTGGVGDVDVSSSRWSARRRRLWLLFPPPLMALWANVHGGFPIGLALIAAFTAAAGWQVIRTKLARRIPTSDRGARSFAARVPQVAVLRDLCRLGLPRRSRGTATCGTHPSRCVNTRDALTSSYRAQVRRADGAPTANAAVHRRTFACLVASAAASVIGTLANPYGWGVYQYVGSLSKRAAARGIEEWLPAGPDMWTGQCLIASVVLLVALFALARRRPKPIELALIACFLPPAFASARMVVWWLLVSAPIFASLGVAALSPAGAIEIWHGRWLAGRRFEDSGPAARPEIEQSHCHWLPPAVVTGLLVVAAVLSAPALARFNPVATSRPKRTEADLQAVSDALAALPRKDGHRSARLFSRPEWGEYLGWSLWPKVPVFIDGRIEIFPDDVWADYARVAAGADGWDRTLDRFGVDYLVLDESTPNPLLKRVTDSDQWSERFRSGPAVLFERTAVQPICPSIVAAVHVSNEE